ncbi:MAG TPA: hypothetical protein VNY05_00650 [Candidatus Acidoferrales bacterium]|nr:hypothetical protein [Candidatus Acidoferrales bacterium]
MAATMLVVIAPVGTVIIPFYRRAVGLSVSEYFGKRFGRPTRVDASVAFTLAHYSKMWLVFYLPKPAMRWRRPGGRPWTAADVSKVLSLVSATWHT